LAGGGHCAGVGRAFRATAGDRTSTGPAGYLARVMKIILTLVTRGQNRRLVPAATPECGGLGLFCDGFLCLTWGGDPDTLAPCRAPFEWNILARSPAQRQVQAGAPKSNFLSAKVKSCCSEGGSPSSLGREAPEFRTKELDGKV